MRKLEIRRPSAAMIVALVALCMSVVGTAAAAGVFSHQEKKGIKKIANKQINKRATGLTVGNANFAKNVMAVEIPQGTISGQTNTCAIGSQTGGITTALAGAGPGVNGFCDITFPRSVEKCVVGASPMHPLSDIGGEASVRPLGGAKVRVTRSNSVDNFRDAGLVSVYAICPA
jgi:hypothetical protein